LDTDAIPPAHSIHSETHDEQNAGRNSDWQSVLGHRPHTQRWIGADGDIRFFARRGADRILDAHPEAAPGDEVVKDAEAAFEKLIDEMVLAASEIDGYREAHPGTIGEETLRKALSILCPLFPIC